MNEKYFVDLVKVDSDLGLSAGPSTYSWVQKMRNLKGEFQTTKHEFATFSDWLKDKHKIEFVYYTGGIVNGIVGLNFDTEHDYMMFLLKKAD